MAAPPWLTTQEYAHRGLHDGERPENSLAAFAAAIDGGFGIELDVRASRDGIAMVIHDSRLDRLTGRADRVRDLTAAALGAITIPPSTETIPTLAAALAFVADRVPVLIEIKNPRVHTGTIEPAVAEAVREYTGRAAVMSWNVFSVLWFRRHAPEIPRGLVVTSFLESRHFSNRWMVQAAHLLPAAAITGADFLAHDVRHLPTHLSKRYRRRGRPVLTWTVRTAEDRRRAEKYADAAIFEGSA